MIGIVEHSKGLWILEEEGQSVLLSDCLKFGLTKVERVWLFQTLQEIVERIQKDEDLAIFVVSNQLKHLDRQEETKGLDIWEVREPGKLGRILFIREGLDSIVVAAVHKSKASHSQAIKRGARRWKDYLKERVKLLQPKL